MTEWEYRVISRELRGAYWTIEMTEEVSKLGRSGWELIAAYPVIYEVRLESPGTQKMIVLQERWVFKRPLASGTDDMPHDARLRG